MIQEIDRIAYTTEFNGIKLLLGTGERIDFQVNTRNTETVDRISFDPAQADMTITSLGLDNSGVNDKFLARETVKKIDQAFNHVNELRATFGSIQNRLISTTDNIVGNLENVTAAHSRIRDTDIAVESSELAKKNLMLQSGTAILSQANQLPGQALSLLNKG
jgi:flagellin